MKFHLQLERFKKDQHFSHALHCKFDINTADKITDPNYHHLQVKPQVKLTMSN